MGYRGCCRAAPPGGAACCRVRSPPVHLDVVLRLRDLRPVLWRPLTGFCCEHLHLVPEGHALGARRLAVLPPHAPLCPAPRARRQLGGGDAVARVAVHLLRPHHPRGGARHEGGSGALSVRVVGSPLVEDAVRARRLRRERRGARVLRV